MAASARAQGLELLRVLGAMAVATLRVEGLKSQIDDQRGTITLAQSRLSAGFGTPLEVDRLQIELSRTEQQLIANEGDMRMAQVSCSSLLGMRCAAFASSEDARAFLDAWVARARAANGSPEQRPDVRALDATRRAAEAETELAKAQAIPDPTVRVGYVYDQFVISGNQRHSFNVSVALPIPMFDAGEAQRAAAEARRVRASAARARILEVARARTAALREVLESRQKRREIIVSQMLPRARGVVADLDKAANARLIPVSDVIQARRTLSELLINEAESHGDAFQTSVELLAETGSTPLDVVPQGESAQ